MTSSYDNDNRTTETGRRASMRGRLRGALVGALALALSLAIVPSAWATGYGQTGVVGGGLGWASGVAVDQSSGNVYLSEFQTPAIFGTVARFEPIGGGEYAPATPATMGGGGFITSVAVDPDASHDVYAPVVTFTSLSIKGFNQAGAELGSPFPFPVEDSPFGLARQIGATSGGVLRTIVADNVVNEYSTATGEVAQEITCSTCPSPAHFAEPQGVAVDSLGNIYVANQGGAVNERQKVVVTGSGGTFTLTFDGQTTAPIEYGVDEATFRITLEGLTTIGAGNVEATRSGSGPYTYSVEFTGSLAAVDVDELTADDSALEGGEAGVDISTVVPGGNFEGRIVKFGPEGDSDPTAPTVFASDPAVGIAVNPANGHVFASRDDGAGWHIIEYDPAGNEISDFGLGSFKNQAEFPPQVAVDGGSGVVFAINQFENQATSKFEGHALVFSPLPAPTATTDPATGLTSNQATLNGKADPNEVTTEDCHFEYVTKTAFEATEFTGATSVACSPDPEESADPVAVSATAEALSPSTTYVYRLVEETEGGKATGSPVEFTTPSPKPKATTEAASGVSQTKATLNGKVDAEGDDADCSFQYGTTVAYGTTVPCSVDPVTGTANTAVSAALSGLSPGTTYHYRVVATNGGGTTNGSDMTFSTPADTCATNAALCPPPPPPAGGGGSTPPPTTSTPPPTTKKPLKCKKGFKKKTVKGKQKCVKVKKKKKKK